VRWPVVKIIKFNCHSLENNGVTIVTFWGHVTMRLVVGNFLWVVHCDHASILHRYGEMKPQMLDGRTLRWFYTLSNAIALHWTDNNYNMQK